MTDRQLRLRLGAIIKDLRLTIRWTQRELSARSGVSQSLISGIENGRIGALTFASITTLVESMGGRLIVDVARPFLGERPLQRDLAHARCASFVAGRLRSDGWQVATEVEVGGDRSRGWIDILAFDPRSGALLVIEIKTEVRDMGGIERSLGWYEREARSAARRRGWRVTSVVSCLLLLATRANDLRLRENRAAFAAGFPLRARGLTELIGRSAGSTTAGRGVAMIDPLSRRAIWLRPTSIDGRRSPAPHVDYVSFLASLQRGSRRRRER